MIDERPFTVHITKVGQSTLHSVAQEHYGDPRLWGKIHEANPKVDPWDVPAGTHLVIPPYRMSAEKPRYRPYTNKRMRFRW